MGNRLVLLVSIRGSYTEAKKCIKNNVTDINYRRTVRDMTVQYWRITGKADQIDMVCGVIGNRIWSSFVVNKTNSFDYKDYFTRTDFSPIKRVAFNCDIRRDELIGVTLPPEWAFSGGNMLRTIDYDMFELEIKSQLQTLSYQLNHQQVMDSMKKDGVSLDYPDGKRRNYDDRTDYAQPKFGIERSRELNSMARCRANNQCELIKNNKCTCGLNIPDLEKKKLEVHHIEEMYQNPSENDYYENLILICRRFHRNYHYHMKENEKNNIKILFNNIREQNK